MNETRHVPNRSPSLQGWTRGWRTPTVRRSTGTLLVSVIPLLILGALVWFKPWVPVLDMAMTELRVRDVGTDNTPLIGLPGRIGNFPEQGSHAGPWSFYLVAMVYRLTGASSRSMEFASVVINTALIGGAAVLAKRRYGARGIVGVAIASAFAVRAYSSMVLAQPWNPYFPVLVWAVAVFAAVLIFDGRPALAPIVVALSSLAAQTHVPYLVPAVILNVAVLVWLLRSGAAINKRHLSWGVGVALVMWLPPLVEQFRRDPGNLRAMFEHFTTSHPEPAIGLGRGFAVVTQHLDPLAMLVELFTSRTPAIERATDPTTLNPLGLLVLVGFVAATVSVWRQRRRALMAPAAVGALLLVVDWIAISRIFGKVWFYLTLWMPTTAVLVWIVFGIVAYENVDRRRERLRRGQESGATGHGTSTGARFTNVVTMIPIIIVVALGMTSIIVDVARYRVPEGSQGAPVGELMPELMDRLDERDPGAAESAGRYLLYWQEAVLSGSQGLALLNELDRRGVDVGAADTWRVPATLHRVADGRTARGELHLVSGVWIDRTAERDGFELLATADTRSDAEIEEFDRLQAEVISELEARQRDDLVPEAEESIFKLSLNESVPASITANVDRMIEIGVPVAVFYAPAGTGLGTTEFP